MLVVVVASVFRGNSGKQMNTAAIIRQVSAQAYAFIKTVCLQTMWKWSQIMTSEWAVLKEH